MNDNELVGQEETEEAEIGTDTSEVVEITGQEENEEDEIAAMERGEEIIGFSFKKFRKKVGKKIKPLKRVAKFVAPVAVFPMLAAARAGKPIGRKIGLIKKTAQTPPQMLAQQMRDEEGRPASIEKAIETQAMAQQALENLQAAAEVQEQAYEDTGDFSAYDPYPEDWMYDESVEGDELSLYEWGAMAGMNDVLGFSLKKLVRKVGRKIDPTKKGSPFRSALAAVPGIGPQLVAGADMLAKARAGDKAAQKKIDDVKKLADAGDPRGKEALSTLQAANVLAPKMKLHSIFSRYEYGARVAV